MAGATVIQEAPQRKQPPFTYWLPVTLGPFPPIPMLLGALRLAPPLGQLVGTWV